MEERREEPKKEFEHIEVEFDKDYAKQILMRAAKYVWSYLEGYPICWDIIEKEGNPKKGTAEQLILVIRVWIPIEDIDHEGEMDRGSKVE